MLAPYSLEALRPVEENDEIELAYLADKYACWLHPKLVERVGQANRQPPNYSKPSSLPAVPAFIAAQYLWPGSTCFYPGTRRKIGGLEERGSYLGLDGNALRIDSTGNARAEQVWDKLASDTIMRPKRSAKSTDASSSDKEDGEPAVYRNGYHLVHLFPHKPSEVARLLTKSDLVTDINSEQQWNTALVNGFPGLFTSAANMCLLPGELTKPTDARSKLRDVLWYRAVQLYGVDFLPPLLRPLGLKLIAQPPLSELPNEVCFIGQEQSDVWWNKVDAARRQVFDRALRKWDKVNQLKQVAIVGK